MPSMHGMFAYIWLEFYGKCTAYMDPMGLGLLEVECSSCLCAFVLFVS